MAKDTKKRDIIIIGAGMAGLTAALYTGRMNLTTLVLENALVGGQIANATGIENYPGYEVIKGGDLIATLQKQAEHFGAVVDEFDAIVKVDLTKQTKIVETEGCIYEADAVILATGMNRRKLPLPEEGTYAGRGVHYCELCDGHMYQDKIIAVMGGGNAAVDAANFLSKYGRKVYLIHRSELRADPVSQEKLRKNPKAEILLQTEVRALHGDGRLTSVTLYDKAQDKTRELPVDGIFVNIGVIPNTALFKGQVTLTPEGRIAAGDVREKEIRQLTTAAADGTTAALLADKYLASRRA